MIKNIFYKRMEIGLPEAHALVLKASGKMIGMCDFVFMNFHQRVGEIGYVLNRKFWGQGLMVEAGKEVIKLAFERFKLIRLQVAHDINNHQSQRVIEKLGFILKALNVKLI